MASDAGEGVTKMPTIKNVGSLVALIVLAFAALADAQPARRRAALYDKLDEGIALLLAEPDFSTTWQAHRYDPGYSSIARKVRNEPLTWTNLPLSARQPPKSGPTILFVSR